jgi:hypothetical protein
LWIWLIVLGCMQNLYEWSWTRATWRVNLNVPKFRSTFLYLFFYSQRVSKLFSSNYNNKTEEFILVTAKTCGNKRMVNCHRIKYMCIVSCTFNNKWWIFNRLLKSYDRQKKITIIVYLHTNQILFVSHELYYDNKLTLLFESTT